MENNTYRQSKDTLINNNEINLKYYLNTLYRNKKIVGYITFFSLVGALISYLATPKIWEGKFQIVLSTKEEKLDSLVSGYQENLFRSVGNRKNQLNTEVGILESPSVLMPIFNFVKTKNEKLLFSNWKNKLEIDLKKNTSILNITYKDKNKELIEPVLQKISEAFQIYSGRNKSRQIELAKEYLTNQISTYKDKSANSIKKAQKFAIDEDLLIQDGLPLNLSKSIDNGNNEKRILPYSLSNTSIESKRVALSNQIRNLKEQIENIKNLNNNNPQQIQYIGATIPALAEEGLPQLLTNIEDKLLELESKFTKKDPQIKLLKERRIRLINLLTERAIGILSAEIGAKEASMKSSTRAEGVILRYKELMREAERDESTLIELENQFRELLLSEAKSEDPWELITIPTLMDDPVSPRLRNYVFNGLIFGLIFSFFISKFFEKKSGLVYEKEVIEDYFSVPILINYSLNDQTKTFQYDATIIKKILEEDNNISLIKVGTLDENIIQNIKSIFNKVLSKKTLNNLQIIYDNFDEIESKDSVYLLVDINELLYSDLLRLKERLDIFNIKLKGILMG